MRQGRFLVLALALGVVLGPGAPVGLAIWAGTNYDVHQDIMAPPGQLPNDFHIEGWICSGPANGFWAVLPDLFQHINGPFPFFRYRIEPRVNPDYPTESNWFWFTADWWGAEVPYCTVLHLGLLFGVEYENVLLDLHGWWTRNGVRVGEVYGGGTIVANGGFVPVVSFGVADLVPGRVLPGWIVVNPPPVWPIDPIGNPSQFIRLRNDSSSGGGAPIDMTLLQTDVVPMANMAELQAYLGPDPFAELRTGGLESMLPWRPVGVMSGGTFTPISPVTPQYLVPDSFFDVFLESVAPPDGLGTVATPFTVPQGGFLISRQLVRFANNQQLQEDRWFWEIHGADTAPQACCFPDGSCADQPPDMCVAAGGFPNGPGTTCATTNCPVQNQACCHPDGTCTDQPANTCVAGGGTPKGVGTACAIGPVQCQDCDWNQGDPAKWIQSPDTTVDGIDIRMDKEDGKPRILADDFLCTETGLITDVHLWVSWLHDMKGAINSIHLSIHSDIPDPDGEGPLYSMPGPELWSHNFGPTDFTEKLYSTLPGMGEWWWDPANGALIQSGDNQIWQVNICIDPSIAFMQQGTPQAPVVYWLDVSVATSGGQIGWKTRSRQDGHFNDDAVWKLEGTSTWNELRYPQGHPNHPESLDLAFVLTGETLQDFGDAPEPPYPTLLASNGARHGPSNMYMGNLIDYEPDGQPNPIATGDDVANLPDEDGVSFLTPLAIGQPAQVAVTVTSPRPAFLTAWIDFNGDGTWATPGDQVFAAVPVMPGLNALAFVVPPGAAPGPTFARFRLHGVQTPIAFTGYQPDGEVEDYQVPIVAPVQITAWRSLKTHSGAGELAIVLNAAATATGSTFGGIRVESRNSAAQNGLRKIEVDFSGPVTISNPTQVTVSGALTTGCNASGLGCVMGPVGSYTPSSVTMTAPQTMTIAFANGAAPGDGCYILNIGPTALNTVLLGDTDCKVRMLQSDATGDGLVALADISRIKSLLGAALTPANCGCDQNLAAGINLADISQTKPRFGRRALCP